MARPEGAATQGSSAGESMDSSAESLEEYFRTAPGSGAAAILAFLHIMLCGVVGFGSYYLIRNANEGLLASPHLSWQFFIPAGMALALYIPTNPLSRVLAASALGFGILAVIALGFSLALVLTDATRQFEEITTGLMLGRIGMAMAAAGISSLIARWFFLRALPVREK